MSSRFNNKNLLIILAGLLVVLLLTVVIKIPREKSTLKEKIVDIDTSNVYKIIIIPRAAIGKPFEFVRENRKWTVRQDAIVSEPRSNAIENILSEILSIKPESLASTDESKWKDYELTDTLATRLKLLNKKGKKLADLMIGKVSYKQVSNPYSYRGNNIEGTSFVRLAEDKKVYSVEGFLAFSFGGNFNDWRDKSFLKCKREDLTKISFVLPSDSGFVLMKKDSLWFADNKLADSLKTVNYLNSIQYMDGEDFFDGFNPLSSPVYQLNIEGNNLLNISIKCYREEGEDEFIFNSSLNPQIYFKGSKDGMFDKLFKSLNYFINF